MTTALDACMPVPEWFDHPVTKYCMGQLQDTDYGAVELLTAIGKVLNGLEAKFPGMSYESIFTPAERVVTESRFGNYDETASIARQAEGLTKNQIREQFDVGQHVAQQVRAMLSGCPEHGVPFADRYLSGEATQVLAAEAGVTCVTLHRWAWARRFELERDDLRLAA